MDNQDISISKNQDEQKNTKLKIIRHKRNLTQKELSLISGINIRNINCYEQKARDIDGAKLSTLLDLCIALNCTLKDILEDEETIKKLEFVYNTIDNNINKTIEKDTYEKYLIKKYFNNADLMGLTEDQKAGIKFISEDFPESWKEILFLRYINEFTLDKIATEKGITPQRVQQISSKAIQQLEQYEESDYVILGLQRTKNLAQNRNEKLIFDRSIDDLKLSGRAYNCLMRAGYTTIGEVFLAKNELINIKNIGKNIVEEICDKIDLYIKEFKSKR